MIRRGRKNGFGLLEIVIAISVISVCLFSLSTVSSIALKVIEENTKNLQAAFLMEEGLEAIRILRDSSWDTNIANLNPETDYYLYFSSKNNWQATSSNIYIDGIFERKFSVKNVYRDSNDDIISSGGTLDSSTKKFTVSVSWFYKNATTTKTISTYLTKLF